MDSKYFICDKDFISEFQELDNGSVKILSEVLGSQMNGWTIENPFDEENPW